MPSNCPSPRQTYMSRQVDHKKQEVKEQVDHLYPQSGKQWFPYKRNHNPSPPFFGNQPAFVEDPPVVS